MDDIYQLDLSFRRLQHDIAQGIPPAAVAVALSEFLLNLPDNLQGCDFYAAEAAKPWSEAVQAAPGLLHDPELRSRIMDAFSLLKASGHLESGAWQPGSACTMDVSGTELAQTGVPTTKSTGERHQFVVHIPVVHRIPAPAQGHLSHVGAVATVVVKPKQREAGERQDHWIVNSAKLGPRERLQLEDVSAQALQGALHALGTAFRSTLLRRLVNRSPRYLTQRIGFELSLETLQMGIAGESAGLGLAAAFAGILASTYSGRGRQPNMKLAWTGRITTTGEIAPVAEESLRAKVRAAAFHGLSGIVVPASMETGARGHIPAQTPTFSVYAVSTLQEALQRV